MILDPSIPQFLDDLASKSATPGGGSAAAIMGAMGAALVSMVGHLTLGKKNYEAVQDDIQALLAQSECLRARFADLVSADVAAFDRVMSAYALPKDTEAQKQARSAAIQDALKAATDVPMACARAAAEAIALTRVAAEKGNKNVVADAGVAVVAAYAALRSAALNVQVNTGMIRDGDFVASRLEELNTILAAMDAENEAVYQLVKAKL